MLSLLKSTLLLPSLLKSMLLRWSELSRLASILGRELGPAPGESMGDSVALTLSSSAGVAVLIGGSMAGLLSRAPCIELRFERTALGLMFPPAGGGGANKSPGI